MVKKLNKKFLKFINDNFYLETEEIDEFREMIIIDYIYSSMKYISVADSNFRKNIVRFFDIDSFMIEYLLNMVKKIYDEYPKWINRGNV